MDNEFKEFYPITYPKVDNVPIVETDSTTGRQKVRMEEKHFYEADDYGFNPTKSARKRMRKRRTNDAKKAKCEVVVHNLKETVREEYSSNELFWVAESNKFLQWTWDEMSPEHLGNEAGIDLELGDVIKTSRIYVLQEYYNDDNPLPMIVQLKDEETANKVKKAMYSAGCYIRRIRRRKYGLYKKVSDKNKDKEIDDILMSLPYGRPSTTKAERDLARKKKEYKLGQSFKYKTTYQEFRKEMDVDYNYLNEKYTKGTKDGIKQLIKKPKTVSNRVTNTEKVHENENDQITDNDLGEEVLFNPKWFVGDHCRVKCAFDGQVHEAKLLKQNTENPLVFKLYILGYGYKEDINCSLFKNTKGEKAQKAQIEAVVKSKKSYEENGNGTSEETSSENISPNLRQEEREKESENKLNESGVIKENLISVHPVPSQEEGDSGKNELGVLNEYIESIHPILSQEEGNSRKNDKTEIEIKDKFSELKEELETEFANDLKMITNLDESNSSILRENSLENNDLESNEDTESEADQELELGSSENESNGRTALPNGAAAHTVSTRREETETEEESPPAPQEDPKSQHSISKSAKKRLRKKRVFEEKMAMSENDIPSNAPEIVDNHEKTQSLNSTVDFSTKEAQGEDIVGFTNLLFKDLAKSAKNSFNYELVEGEELENIIENVSDSKAGYHWPEIFESMMTRSRSLSKDNLILKPKTPLRKSTSVQTRSHKNNS